FSPGVALTIPTSNSWGLRGNTQWSEKSCARATDRKARFLQTGISERSCWCSGKFLMGQKTERAAERLPFQIPKKQRMRLSLCFLFFRRLIRRRSRRWRQRRVVAGHAFLEIANAFAQSAHDLRNLPAAKQNQNDRQHHEPMKNTKLTHENLHASWRLTRYFNPSAGRLRQQPYGITGTYRITRSSPARRVTRSRSKYSSSGIAYLRVIPVNSLNAGTEMRSPLAFL